MSSWFLEVAEWKRALALLPQLAARAAELRARST